MYAGFDRKLNDLAERAFSLREEDDRWRQVARHLDEARKIAKAIGISPRVTVGSLTEGYVRKGGRNLGESQIKERPAPPGPMKQ
jgi:hypothetical protein